MPRPLSIDTTSILRTLTQEPQKPSLLCEKLKASRSTVHRKLTELLEEGLVVKTGKGPRAAYRLPLPEDALTQARQQVEGSRILLSLPARQAYQVSEVLETYGRIGLGQVERVVEFSYKGGLKRYDGTNISWEHIEPATARIQRFKTVVSGFVGAAHQIKNSPSVRAACRTAWDLMNALRHRLAWDENPKGSMRTWHDEPMSGEAGQSLFVGSDGPSQRERFMERRYHLEMDPTTASVLLDALRCGVRLYKGDLSVLLEMVREGLVPHQHGTALDEKALGECPGLLSSAQDLLFGTPQNPGDTPPGGQLSATILQRLAGALQTLLVDKPNEELRLAVDLGAAEDSLHSDALVALVERARSSPFSFQLLDIPEEMLVSFKQGKYRIIGPSKIDESQLVILGSSHSLQTAIMMARNLSKGQHARAFTF